MVVGSWWVVGFGFLVSSFWFLVSGFEFRACRAVALAKAGAAGYFVMRKNLRIASALLHDVNSAADSAERSARLRYAMSWRYGHCALSGAAVYNAQRFIEHYRRERGTGNGERGTGVLSLEVSFERNVVVLKNPSPRPLKESIVTIGGVDISEIDPHTMQSRIVPGLYFAGEVMDIDGPTGGYNLTLAFATARKAVTSL